MPRATHLLLSLLWSLGCGGVLAGEQQYVAPLDAVKWTASSQKLHCTLTHEIPHYGRAVFAQEAGDALTFTMEVKQAATRNRDKAHLRSLPPQWKHQVEAVDLEEVDVIKGFTPFKLSGELPRRMLAELQKGMFPTFSYRDWIDARDLVTVSLPGIHIKQAMDTFVQCLAKLPVYKFSDYKVSNLLFAFGKHELTGVARQRLDDLARFLKTDTSVKRIELHGHTDDVGRKRANDALGARRVEAVREYLISKGVTPSLFKLATFGERKPLATNKSDQGRTQNRRVEVVLAQ
jgi:outer membrane protein OmpA-like peptidoglycan-associated protein